MWEKALVAFAVLATKCLEVERPVPACHCVPCEVIPDDRKGGWASCPVWSWGVVVSAVLCTHLLALWIGLRLAVNLQPAPATVRSAVTSPSFRRRGGGILEDGNRH